MAEQPVNNNAENIDFERGFSDNYEAAQNTSAMDLMDQLAASPAKGGKLPQENQALPAPKTEAPADNGLGITRDISLGVIQAPREIARGVVKGVNSMAEFIHQAADYSPDITTLTPEGEHSVLPRITTHQDARDRQNKELTAAEQPTLPTGSAEFPLPAAPKVSTVTGNIIESIAQFATGLKGAGKIVKGTGAAIQITKGALADLLAFDAHQERLSNVIQQVPELANPVTDYLEAKPGDGFAEGKLKQGIEGLGIGAAGEALFSGIKLLKSGETAAAAMKAEGSTAADLFDVPPEEKAGIGVGSKQFDFLGDTEDSNLLLKKQKIDAAETEVEGAFGKPKQIPENPSPAIGDFEINFARINGPDDIKQLMDDMVNKPELKESIDAARRGKVDQRATLTAATDIDGFDSLMARRTGEALNAEHIVAARQVYYDTTSKLMDAAKRAASSEASDIDQFNFRRMLATHHAVQKEFMGVRAEAGRALAAWNIPVAGTAPENARAVTEALSQFGGTDASKELATRIAALGNNLNTTQLNAIVDKAAGARTAEAMAQLWTQGLLTNPTTHVVNLTSNVLTGLQLGMERMASAIPKNSPIEWREGAGYFSAYLQTLPLAFKNAAGALRTGEVGMGLDKIDLPLKNATSRDLLDPQGKAGLISKAIDGYGYLLNRYVGGVLAAGDEFSKTLLYQAQLRALATREGISLGLEGDALKQHIGETLQNIPDVMRADAVTFANYGTFTNALGTHGQALQRFLSDYPAARMIAPFVRTPANIFKFTFSRTPLGYMSQKIRDDIAAGGVRQATAQTRIAMGTSVMAMASDMAMNGVITGSGPVDPQQRATLRRTGWQPYSVKIGDTYYSYARLDPLATVLGMGADMSEILANYASYDMDAHNDVDQLGVAAGIAVSNQVVGKTFMTGFADLTEVLSDPQRYLNNWKNRMAGSLVPAGVAGIERALSPETSQVFNMMDAMRARIPGLSDKVPPMRNIWGEPIKAFYPNADSIASSAPERLLSLFNPIYYSKERDAPVDRWMLKNGFSIDMPEKVQVFNAADDNGIIPQTGVRVDLRDFPKAYDRLVELRGDQLKLMKYGNQTMHEFFNNLVTEDDPFGRHVGFFMSIGNNYDDQQNFIRKVVSDYTAGARKQVLGEFPEVGQAVLTQRRNQMKIDAVRQPLKTNGAKQ